MQIINESYMQKWLIKKSSWFWHQVHPVDQWIELFVSIPIDHNEIAWLAQNLNWYLYYAYLIYIYTFIN